MANKYRCGCGSRRNSNSYGCLDSVNARWRWENFPYYDGPCPDVDGDYCNDTGNDSGCNCDCDRCDRCDRRRCRRRGMCCGLFTAMLPMAVTANGIVPLGVTGCLNGKEDFALNSGLITLKRAGTYMATYTVRVPEGATLDTIATLNVNDASQSSAITQVGGTAPYATTAQAVFEADAGDTVTLRTSEAINIATTNAQPLFTLSLMKLD